MRTAVIAPMPSGDCGLPQDGQLRDGTFFPEDQAADACIPIDAQPVSGFYLLRSEQVCERMHKVLLERSL